MQEQIDTLPQKNVDGQIAQVSNDINERQLKQVCPTEDDLAEMEKWNKNHAANILKKDTALGYTVNADCIRCGICAKVCPANNITVTDRGVHFSDHCEVCYACLHNCPKSAIHMPLEAGTTHFRNEHITLNEIIGSNQ